MTLAKKLKKAKKAITPKGASFKKGMIEMLKRVKEQEKYGGSAMVGMKTGKAMAMKEKMRKDMLKKSKC